MTVVDASVPASPGAPPAASPSPPIPAAVRFLGDPAAYWRLLIRGSILLALTLGIYRFWYATDIRRFLWSNTEAAGETLEYTGTPYELLIGFLIALALLVPLYVALFIAALGSGVIGQLAGVLSFPLLFFLGQFAIYRARRYRLTRTVYRGVRFHQDGSALRYAIRAVFWWVLIVLTLGLAYPFAQSNLERFKLRHTYYGDLAGRFEGSGWRLFWRGLPMWLLAIGPLVLALFYVISSVPWAEVAAAAERASSGRDFINSLENTFPDVYAAIVIAITAVAASIVMAALLYPVFQAMVLRWWISGLRFGRIAMHSHLRTGQIYRAYLRFLGYSLLFSIGLGVAGAAAFTSVGTIATHFGGAPAEEIVGAVAAVVLYVTAMLGYSAIYQGTVRLALWRVGVESVAIEGAAALDEVRAEGTPSSAVGEGLADALNVGGI